MLTTAKFGTVAKAVAGILSAIALAGCGDEAERTPLAATASSAPDTAASELCWKYGAPAVGVWGGAEALAGAEPATASRVAAWEVEQQQRLSGADSAAQALVRDQSEWSKRAPSDAVVVCFFDGSFNTPRPPVPGKTDAAPTSRFVVVVAEDGTAVPFVATQRELMPVEPI